MPCVQGAATVTPEQLRVLYEQELDCVGPSPGPFTQVIAESFPGAHKRIQRMGSWICEQHPERPWPHDGCPGPGMLKPVPCPCGCGMTMGHALASLDEWAIGQGVGDLNAS